MNLLQVLILSVVEGITEFLPISSTGHLILVSRLLAIPQTEFVKSFEIIIQLGAISAVVVLYFSTFIQNVLIWKRLISAFIPTAVVGLILYKLIKGYLIGNLWVDVIALFVGGLVIIGLEKYFTAHPRTIKSVENLSVGQSSLIGVAQSVAVIPGVSRSTMTIFGGMGLGLNRVAATEFSFLLAVPTIAAAAGLDLYQTRFTFSPEQYLLLFLGIMGAFVSALLTIRWLLGFVAKHSLVVFGVYRIILALVFTIIFLR
jgi:undecaprenyl-diphosphatase